LEESGHVTQRLFNICASLSLVLCVASVASTVWSKQTPRILAYRHLDRRDAVILWNGALALAHVTFPRTAEEWIVDSSRPVPPKGVMELAGWPGRLGFAFDTRTTTPPG
jgi:hypothetical protein